MCLEDSIKKNLETDKAPATITGSLLERQLKKLIAPHDSGLDIRQSNKRFDGLGLENWRAEIKKPFLDEILVSTVILISITSLNLFKSVRKPVR